MTEAVRPRRSWGVSVIATLVVLGLCLVVGEVMVRLLLPQETKYPRQSASPEFGIINYPYQRIIHDVPGSWHFEYTVNRFGHRGADPQISNVYERANVVVLGDSYTFGQGVSDGEEFPAAMQRQFGDRVQVVNLGMPGWGLTQQIRRYFELGQVFHPRAVVLVFCNNDPVDNIRYPVTTVENGVFSFHPVSTEFGAIKRWLSTSWIQKSQLYNFIRGTLYEFARNREEFPDFSNLSSVGTEPSEGERIYVKLLEAFARDLKSREVPLIMVAVNGQLKGYPYIAGKAQEFTEQGLLRYVDFTEWTGPDGLGLSPEGHWGAETQRVNGERLADLISRDYLR